MSASKRKGTAFETAVVNYLREYGFLDVERRALAGVLDKGDVAGIPNAVIECKATKAIDLAGFMDETERERVNANETFGVCVVKRRGKNVRQAYAVVPLERMAFLLHLADVALRS